MEPTCYKRDIQQSLTVEVMLAAEKQVLRDQAKSKGNHGKPKPGNIIDKIISGRINKVNGLLARMQCSSASSTTAHHQQLTILPCGVCTILIANVAVHMFASLIVTMHTVAISYTRACAGQFSSTSSQSLNMCKQQVCNWQLIHNMLHAPTKASMQWWGHSLQSLCLVMQFYEDSCLLKQRFVMADDQSVQVILNMTARQINIGDDVCSHHASFCAFLHAF